LLSVQSEWGKNQSVQPLGNQFSHAQWLSVPSEWGKNQSVQPLGNQFSHAQFSSAQSEWGINQSVQPWVNQFSHSQWLSVPSEWGKKSDSSALGKSVLPRSVAFSKRIRVQGKSWGPDEKNKSVSALENQNSHAQWFSV
jgi:hypothetical protein